MTLARLDLPLTVGDLYPDQVRVTYRYLLPPCGSQVIAAVLRPHGFRTRTGMPGMRSELDLVENADPIPVLARKAGVLVSFTVTINVLSQLHRAEIRSFGDERSISGNNYLHPLAFDESSPVWLLLYQRIVEHEQHMEQLATEIAGASATGAVARLTAINVSHIEVFADFETNNPHATFRALLPAFKERYRRVIFVGYGQLQTARVYGELHHDMDLMRGFLAEGVAFKLYIKTNRRVRLEVEYRRSGLRYLRAPLALLNTDEIQPLITVLSRHCLPEMNELSQTNRNCCDTNWSAYRLIALVAPLFRSDPEDLETLLRCFSLDGRVTTRTLASRKLSRLRRRRIIRRTNHGVYAIEPEYYSAFRALRLVDALWQRALTRRAAPEGFAEAAQ